MNTIKFILINIEMLLMIFSFMFGAGIVDEHQYFLSLTFMVLPLAWTYITNFNAQMHFYDVYKRAWAIAKYNK